MHPFELLAEPVRRRIVGRLARHELPVARLVELVGIEFSVGQSAISHHLRVLRDAGFVEARAVGSNRRYRLAWDAMDRLDLAVEALFVIWEERAGWPYAEFLPEPPARLHREGRRGLRGRTRADIEPRADEDDWWSALR